MSFFSDSWVQSHIAKRLKEEFYQTMQEHRIDGRFTKLPSEAAKIVADRYGLTAEDVLVSNLHKD